MNGHIFQLNFHPVDWYCGRLGVLIFFVHTSLVLMLSMERGKLRSKELYLNFYIRRIFRIYPLSIVAVLMVITFELPEHSHGLNTPVGVSVLSLPTFS